MLYNEALFSVRLSVFLSSFVSDKIGKKFRGLSVNWKKVDVHPLYNYCVTNAKLWATGFLETENIYSRRPRKIN